MAVYYNEIDGYAAQWLRNLIAAGLLPAGEVDERDIRDVAPQDVAGFVQCHFFAGIGGWSHALRLAGWPDDWPVWTGSCPCQPFSAAGQRHAATDSRHLWPELYRLIEECRPSVIFGEQVAGKAGYRWLAGVRANLEIAGYAVGAANLPAAGLGAPHIRQRLFWVGNADWSGPQGCSEHIGERADQCSPWSSGVSVPCLDGKTRRVEPGICPLADGTTGRVGRLRAYGNAIVPQVAAEFILAAINDKK
jgi:DNA (cytosine-5)-methyltransferase 1